MNVCASSDNEAAIKERVRLLDGSLAVESTPGAGARLEITIPQRRTPSRGRE